MESTTISSHNGTEVNKIDSSWAHVQPLDSIIAISDVNKIRLSHQEIRSGINLLPPENHVDTLWLDLGNQPVIDWLKFKRLLNYFSRHIFPFLGQFKNIGFSGLSFLLPGNKEGHLSIEFLDSILPKTIKEKGKWISVPLMPQFSQYYLSEKHYIQSKPYRVFDAFQELGYKIQGEMNDLSNNDELLDDLNGETVNEKYINFINLFPKIERIHLLQEGSIYTSNRNQNNFQGRRQQPPSNTVIKPGQNSPKLSLNDADDKISVQKIIHYLLDKNLLNELEIVELLMVLTGNKKAMRTTVDPHRYEQLTNYLSKNNIYYKSDKVSFKYATDKGKGGWSNLYDPEEKLNGLCNEFMLYIGLSDAVVNNASLFEKENDEVFGEILSYPNCCRVAFERNLAISSKKQGDLVPLVADQTIHDGPWSFLLNTAARYFIKNLISFYPCSYICEKAKAISKQYFNILQEYLPDYAIELKNIMSSPVLYTEYRGIYIFPQANLDNNLLRYNPDRILMTTQNSLGKAICQGTELIINHSDSVDIINGKNTLKTVQGDNVRMLLFNGEM
jgi:hypothetical protein|tara:strand:+ start:827 stop:2500 length:1674 start_codon:yes stop_codon:yes gene_type:complete